MARLTAEEVAKHNKKTDLWVIINGAAYDLTEFLPNHPGGQEVIIKAAGKDASKQFNPVHPPNTLNEYLSKDKHLGQVDPDSLAKTAEKEEDDPEEQERLERVKVMPPLNQCYNLLDFESVARRMMPQAAWAYYSSAADDEISHRENHSAYHRIWFRPRVLVNVENIDISTTMLGAKVEAPFYVTATALGRLGHPDGEINFTKACDFHGVIQMIPTLASCSFDELIEAATDKQTQWLQLYVNSDRNITKRIVQRAEEKGCKGLFITVDAPSLGRREKDIRLKFIAQGSRVQEDSDVDRTQGAARAISSFIDPKLCWDDIPWFQSITKMPIILKGVQCVEDTLKAVEYGCQGVVLSNHGGRQLDFAPSAIEILSEVMPALHARGWQDKLEVYVDGGVRRGTDILKALCLGAKGVGLGRPFLYAMSAYGQKGVERAMDILKDELIMNMRLLGCTKISDLNPRFLDTRSISSHFAPVPADNLHLSAYEPLAAPANVKSKL